MPSRRVKLLEELSRTRPDLEDPLETIVEGRVVVDGAFVTNPNSLVLPGCSITVRDNKPLRGEAKLRYALEHFSVDVTGRVALDAGAAAGGFTKVLLEKGAAKVYAVDAGHGQLIGSLRQDPRVVNLEGVNIGALSTQTVPEPIEAVTLDLSYLSLSKAIPELNRIELAPGCLLMALVKPMFELGLPNAPSDAASLDSAIEKASAAIASRGWTLGGGTALPEDGKRRAIEGFITATRS